MTLTQAVEATAAIAAYDVLEESPSRELRAVAELAARICDVPMATVNLLTEVAQHQIATFGFEPSVCRRHDSMCVMVLHERGPVVVPDTTQDVRFRDNPFVDGRIGNVRFYASHPLRTPGGTVIGTLCVFDQVTRTLTPDQAGALVALAERVVDVLELRLRTRELAESLARQEAIRVELEQSNQRLASLAGQISHDLKSPLTSLSASLEMLRDDLADTGAVSDQLDLLERASRSSRRMATMIDDVLDYARVGGRLELVEVSLAAVAEEVLTDLTEALRGVAVVVDPLPVVRGDCVQLRAVLQNLMANAAKFRRAVDPHVWVSSVQTTDRWRVEIADNGPGVPESERELVFEPLTRGAGAQTGVDGAGIGLATCRRIVEAHGGRIGLAETPGGGTTAWFELPRHGLATV